MFVVAHSVLPAAENIQEICELEADSPVAQEGDAGDGVGRSWQAETHIRVHANFELPQPAVAEEDADDCFF